MLVIQNRLMFFQSLPTCTYPTLSLNKNLLLFTEQYFEVSLLQINAKLVAY